MGNYERQKMGVKRVFEKSKNPKKGKCHIIENGKICKRFTKTLKGGMCRAHYVACYRRGIIDELRIATHPSPFKYCFFEVLRKPKKGFCKIMMDGILCNRKAVSEYGLCVVCREKFRRNKKRVVDGVKIR